MRPHLHISAYRPLSLAIQTIPPDRIGKNQDSYLSANQPAQA